jgi:prevent-host-death family protein
MRMITATEANRDFSKILERVLAGEAIGITKRGAVVATLNPAKTSQQERNDLKKLFIADLQSRTAINGLNRGTRDALYDEEK